ncbi:MAG: FAD-dependent monooxygenase [Pseudomonadota bacterium]
MTQNAHSSHTQIAIVGGGLTGGLSALGFAQKGWDVVHLAPAPTRIDRRSTALLTPSLQFLEELGLLRLLEGKGAPLRIMRLLDGTNRLLRTPPTDFVAKEAGIDAFGINFLNSDLLAAIGSATMGLPNLKRVEASVESAELGDPPTLKLSDGNVITADLVVAGDGRNSVLRQAAGIEVRNWSYPQIAIVGEFSHARGHNFVSTEFHTTRGPFTTVPMPGKRSSLVWVVEPQEADRVLAQKLDLTSRQIEKRLQSSLGKVTLERPLQSFPLAGMIANRFAASGVLLVGEASHVFPPIGAQGLNLGIRDVKDALIAAGAPHNSLDIAGVCNAFHRSRAADVRLRTAGVDALNRSLLTEAVPIQLARSVGLHALANSAVLRKGAMALGLGARRKA